jgi:hypothetical protein
MIRWERYLNREPGGLTLRPPSPQKIARRYNVSVRSLKRWWVTERKAILDKITPPPTSSASYQALIAVERLAQTFRRPNPDRPLPDNFERVERILRDWVEQIAYELPKEERALLTSLYATGCIIFHAALCDGERLTDQDRACQEAVIMGYLANYTN